MQELSLEKEFEFYKKRHKGAVLIAQKALFYKDLQETGTKIPDFMTTDPFLLAQKDIVELILFNPEEVVNDLYEKAWKEMAYKLP